MGNQFKAKQTKITAIQWQDDNLQAIKDFLGEENVIFAEEILQVKMGTGRWGNVHPDWWVARGENDLVLLYETTAFQVIWEPDGE